MLVVPTVTAQHTTPVRNLGPIRGDHALLQYDPSIGPATLPAGRCWPLSPPGRPLSLTFEALPNPPRAMTPRRAPSPVRMGLATNPRVRRRSTDPPPGAQQSQQPPTPPPLVWISSPGAERSPSVGWAGPMKTRASRRSSGAKELLQLLKRSAKKKMERLRRSMSAERLSSSQRSRSSILRPSPGDDSVAGGPAAQRPRASTPNMAPAEDTFPRARLVCVHKDGSHTVRLVRHPHHAFGFFVSLDRYRTKAGQSMFISRMVHPLLEERLSGLLDVGDELLTVENVACANLSLEQLQTIVGSRLVVHLRVQPRPFL